MPQGKLKVKAKLPAGVKTKKKSGKGPAATQKRNRPVAPKKTKLVAIQKLKKSMSQTVNMMAEEDLRQKALEGRQTLGKRKRPDASSAAPTASSSTVTEPQDDGPSRKRRRN